VKFTETITIYSENQTKDTNAFCGHNAELLKVKTHCTFS